MDLNRAEFTEVQQVYTWTFVVELMSIEEKNWRSRGIFHGSWVRNEAYRFLVAIQSDSDLSKDSLPQR